MRESKFPGIVAGCAETTAREILDRANAAASREADGIMVDVNEAALLALAVLSVGESAWPEGVTVPAGYRAPKAGE